MAIWYITTGTSLSESSRCWNFNAELLEEVRRFDNKTHAEFVEEAAEYVVSLREERKRLLTIRANKAAPKQEIEGIVCDKFRLECWDQNRFRALPAEFSTLFLIRNELKTGDQLFFIAGKTNYEETLFLVEIVKHIISRDHLPRGITANSTEPYALDPIFPQQFNESFEKLWNDIGSNLHNKRFILTGGYKALILAIACKLSLSGPTGTCVYYSHESSSLKVVSFNPHPDSGSGNSFIDERTTY